MSSTKTTRRFFLGSSALAGAGLWLSGCAQQKAGGPVVEVHRVKGKYKANEKLNIAGVGCGGKGSSDIIKCQKENVIGLCDVDFNMMADAIKKFPNARKYHDYRVMYDELGNQIDAITCSTPDHMHAPASVTAMRMGKHVYCQKPLTWSVYEARLMAEEARKCNVATQCGNQGTAHNGFRAAVEAIRSGAIGNVTEAHVWTNRPVWPQGKARPKGSDAIPENLDWDLWLGVAPSRPYKKGCYHPFNWRGWWDFGTGALGDMGCHTANMAYMALELGSPTTAEAQNSGFDKDSFPTWSVITLQFPARKAKDGRSLGPVKWTWYDGGNDKPQWVHDRLKGLIEGEKYVGSGLILIGDKGKLYSPNDYGADMILLPKKNFEGWKAPPQTIERWNKDDIDQAQTDEWIRACKDPKKPALSNFGYSGALTEVLLIGNIANYVGKKIEWDAKNLKVTNVPEANNLVRRQYRKGWEQL
jgi:predicted dehydrogenase